jgi:hypothetical protein
MTNRLSIRSFDESGRWQPGNKTVSLYPLSMILNPAVAAQLQLICQPGAITEKDFLYP